ncbi:MAG: ATP-binding protein [Halococcoides sp.]
MVGFRDGLAWDAIVGQDDLKEALEVVAVDDDLGLLIEGETGTAKSTAVRALAERLPAQRAIADCPYGCPPDAPAEQCDSCRERIDPPVETRRVPVVTVPLGATRDRIVGSLAVGEALDGDASFDPGLLARANRGILYVDEVNCLDDHLVNCLLDAAASGVNRVERDGLSRTHPADFTLIGTMNPEEGRLRPQLRDRFALQVSVTGSDGIDERARIIDAALGRADPPGDATRAEPTDLDAARDRLADIGLPTEHKRRIAAVCADSGVDGHRADIAAARAAIARAALAGRSTVIEADVDWALERGLAHRRRGDPFESTDDPFQTIEDSTGSTADSVESSDESSPDQGGGAESVDGEGDGGGADETPGQARGPDHGGDRPSERGNRSADDTVDTVPDDGDATDRSGDRGASSTASASGTDEARDGSDGPAPDGRDGASDRVHTAARPAASVGRPDIEVPEVGPAEATGDRPGTTTDAGAGPRVRVERAAPGDDVDAAATARAAARTGGVDRDALRRSVDRDAAPALIAIAIDASASMGPAIERTKAVATATLNDAYADRDRVAVVEMRGESASVCVPPTDSVSVAARYLAGLAPGERSPLVEGCQTLADVLADADAGSTVAVVVTDGHPTVADRPLPALESAAERLGAVADRTIVVAAGEGPGIDRIAAATDGSRIDLDALTADRIARARADDRD